MSHQPFETWLLAGEALTAEQAERLRDHLQECAACRALQAAWAEVEGELRSSPWAEPAPGFTARWQARLALAERKAESRQAWLALGCALGGASGVLAVLGLGVMGSFGQLAAGGLRTLAGWAADLQLVADLLRVFIGGLPQPVPLVSGAGLVGILTVSVVGLAAMWFVAVQRLVIRVH
jgi:anti-sigma factor RsiW